jgi:hypothetical protein
MQMSVEEAHARLRVGSHWLPRLVFEAHTSYVPEEVVTGLQRLKTSAVAHEFEASGVHAM